VDGIAEKADPDYPRTDHSCRIGQYNRHHADAGNGKDEIRSVSLKALGMTRGRIGRIFVIDGMIVGVIGVLIGNALGFILCFMQHTYKIISIPGEIYYMNYVPIAIVPFQYIIVSGIALTMCFICTLIPAYLAGRLDPIRTIRFA
jgi:lipoprotein-releasing system permease protein